MEHKFDYYFINSSFKGGTVPRLQVDDEVNSMGTAFLAYYKQTPETLIAYLCFGPPIPPKPSLDIDGLTLEGNCSVFSKKIYEAVVPHNFKGIQFVPTVIRGLKDEEFDNFYIANIYQEIASFDPDKTEFKRIDRLTNTWSGIKKIVLDKDVLSQIPLEDRLVFVAKEHPTFILYHKTIVDVIMATKPDGLNIIPVEEWYEGIRFKS